MIEYSFGEITRQVLRVIQGGNRQKLVERIYNYFEEVNEISVVFH